MNVLYEPPARQELAEAVAYYSQRSPELADRFVADLDSAVERVIQFPHASPPLDEGLRRCLLSNFPYQLVYRVEGDTIRVYAVAHQKRRPGYWRKRVGP